ncbi:energy-coupling factor ABC transporter ATP-binding protein [Tepidibacillus decaturensis]|uniref:energy-coupling factor ABC transporter ATP-binding protein n=1 Tax=Tepidibacillus decaturensis TaxID=1413211 RepID=UPI000B0D3CF3|nr:ABC transporter ATP-binding protein [Tepidibacillus decaturensis]
MKSLEIKNLHFSYTPENEVLKGINLHLGSEPTAIIGQNGAGKSTFVKLLKGLLKPTEGEIIFDGRNTKDYTVASLAKHIGLVFQNPNDQIFKNTVISEVMFGPLNIGQDELQAKNNAFQALKKVHLEQYIETNPYDLSLSERKMITIASILAMDTDVVIFDEPTMGQDHAGKQILKKSFENFMSKERSSYVFFMTWILPRKFLNGSLSSTKETYSWMDQVKIFLPKKKNSKKHT